jgi:AraC family transcriptional activator of pobA
MLNNVNNGFGNKEFAINDVSELIGEGFSLYSTINLENKIGLVKKEFFKIALIRKGIATAGIGFKAYEIKRNYILFGIPEQVFSIHNFNQGFLGYYMLFTQKYVFDSFQKSRKKEFFPFLTYTGVQGFELQEDVALEIENIIFKMNDEIKQSQSSCSDMIGLYIQQILIIAHRNYDGLVIQRKGSSNASQVLFESYIGLVSKDFMNIRKVGQYADKLNVSADYLNRAIKSCTDKTAHHFINKMIFIEAKNLLIYSEMTVSEIGYSLDFSDPSHFNRSFKKFVGLTPLEFRNKS